MLQNPTAIEINESVTVEFSRMPRSRRSYERLKGGAQDNDSDVLHMDELDEPLPQKKIKIEEPKEKKQPSEAKRKKLKCKTIMHYTVIVILLIIWAIFAVLLLLVDESKHDPRFLTIPPAGEPRPFEISVVNLRHLFGITITGPFNEKDHLDKSKKNDTILQLQLQRTYGDEAMKDISKEYKIGVVEMDNYNLGVPVKKTHIFNLESEEYEDFENSKIQLLLTSNAKSKISVKIEHNEKPVDKKMGIIFGGVVLLFLYAMIVWEIIDRTLASVISSTLALSILAVFDSRPSLDTIISWIDMETMLLLFGMMIIVGILSDSGIFDYLAVLAYKISKGHIWPLVNSLCCFTAILSAFLDSVTMMLLVTPIIIKLCEATAIDPVTVLIFLVLYSNITAATTPVGDPPNIIITSNPYISGRNVNFGNFIAHTLPCILLTLVQTYIQLRLKYRKVSDLEVKVKDPEREIYLWERAAGTVPAYTKDADLVYDSLQKKVDNLKRKLSATELELEKGDSKKEAKQPAPNYEEVLNQLQSSYGIRNKLLLYKSLIVFVFVVLLFVLHSVEDLHHLSMGWTALVGAILILILADIRDLEAILARIEWSTLIFFASLFILMESLAELGLIELLSDLVVKVVLLVEAKYHLMVAMLIIVWVAGVGSAFLDNIPVSTMMLRIVISLAENDTLNLPLHPLVWTLALASCFGGNGTLIGASANVVTSGVAGQHGYKITFTRYFLMGFPVMIGNLIMLTAYLLVCHCAFEWHTPKPGMT